MACGDKDLCKGNVIFESDDKYPLCVENVINVFNVINKSSKHRLNMDLKTIINKMSHYYNINEQETRRCIASLYLDAAINIRIDDNIIYYSSNIRGRRYYPSVLREKIRQNILKNICKMYVKMNLIIDNIASEFSMDNLMNYLIKENVKIPRIRLTTNLLLNCLEKLCHNGFLKKNDFSMFTITIKSIKFGQKFEEFKNYCKNVNVQTIYRQRKSISNNFIQSEKCNNLPIFWNNNNNNNNDVPRNLNIQFGTHSSNILTHFNKYNTVNMMKNQISPGFYNNEALSMSMGNISFISQGFTCCNFCGQSLNENGNILQCNGCNINAHVPCKSFFNCSRSLKWCSSCLYPFQVSTENGEFVDLLCQDCFNQRMCDMCPSCQEIMDGTNVEIVQLESFEMKDNSDNAFPKSHLISVEESTFEAYGPNSQSFVEMLNGSEEISTLEKEKEIPVKSWTSKDVETWLIKEGYPRMCTKFKNEEIDGKSLMLLVEEDLRLMNLNENIVSELYKIIKKLK